MNTRANEVPEFDSLTEAIEYFADPQQAHELAVMLRWPNGVVCPHCKAEQVTFLQKYFRYQCKSCKKQFTVKSGTLMEDSALPLKTWLTGVWLITNAKNGISSCEIARSLHITQKSAWFLLHRIRIAMHSGTLEKITGVVEVDETYIGGLEGNKHKNKKKPRGVAGKQIVMGIFERATDSTSARVRAKVIPNTVSVTLLKEVNANVNPGSTVMTDAYTGYRNLAKYLEHKFVDHRMRYVEGQVHTNGLENFWSLFSRTLHGTYTHVDPQHLNSYVDEQAHRFNQRHETDKQRFLNVARRLTGKRLMYTDLKNRMA